nr:MAG TPA: hypothetical protein [Caudoviricetes sp.]
MGFQETFGHNHPTYSYTEFKHKEGSQQAVFFVC